MPMNQYGELVNPRKGELLRLLRKAAEKRKRNGTTLPPGGVPVISRRLIETRLKLDRIAAAARGRTPERDLPHRFVPDAENAAICQLCWRRSAADVHAARGQNAADL